MASLLEYVELYRDNLNGVASQTKICIVEFRMSLGDALRLCLDLMYSKI